MHTATLPNSLSIPNTSACIFVVFQFYPWFESDFPLFQTHYNNYCALPNPKVSAVARPNSQPRQAGVARGVRGHAPPPPPREILNFSLSEMRFAEFSGPFGNFFSS